MSDNRITKTKLFKTLRKRFVLHRGISRFEILQEVVNVLMDPRRIQAYVAYHYPDWEMKEKVK